jgi:hypothetical protein
MDKKTDNHNFADKLGIRRYFLDKYHKKVPPVVFDCCQGEKLLWSILEREYVLDSYFGVDLKLKKGRLKIDSSRILEQKGFDFDVVDVDTYGEPWKHFLNMLPHITKPCTVFLTIATIKAAGGGNISKLMAKALGVHNLTNLSQALRGKISLLGTDQFLGMALKYCEVQECKEVESSGNARYLGLRLVPKRPTGV